MAQPSRPLVDAGNPYLSTEIVASVDIGKVPLPSGGEIGFATIRSGNATLSVPMTRETAGKWVEILTQLRDMLSGAGLATAVQAPLVAAVPGQLK